MDSFVLAELFKYLYLLFADEESIPINIDNYVFTTEAHLLPLTLSNTPNIPAYDSVSVKMSTELY